MIERSGERAIRKIIEDFERDRRLIRQVGAILGRGIFGSVGGILFPSDIGRSDRPLADIKVPPRERIPKRISPVRVPTRKPLEPLPRELEEIKSPTRERKPLRETRRLDPIRAPSRARLPNRLPQIPGYSNLPIWTAIITGAISAVQSNRTRSGLTRYVDPLLPDLLAPLTPNKPSPLPSPQPQPTVPRTQQDLCRDMARKQRKKRRKCDQRQNVVWAGGPSKGKIAGSRCFKWRA